MADSGNPRRPFYEHLGLEVVSSGEGRSVVRLPDNPALHNSRGDVHGGAITTLLDAAMSSAARAAIDPGFGSASIQFTTHFLIPGRGTLRAEGRVIRAGSSVVTAEAQATDAAGNLVASALGTMKVIRPRAAPARR